MAGDHQCPVCHATFTRPQHVARHMRSHTGDRPYKCVHCGDQFARSDLLSRHVNKCHASEKPPITTAPNNRRKGHTSSSTRATTSKQACDQCVVATLPCDGSNPCTKCVQRRMTCTYVKFQRQTAPVGPGHKASASTSSSASGVEAAPAYNTTSSSYNNNSLSNLSSHHATSSTSYNSDLNLSSAGLGLNTLAESSRNALGLPIGTGLPRPVEELYLAPVGNPNHQQNQHRLNLSSLNTNPSSNVSVTGDGGTSVYYHLEPAGLTSSIGGRPANNYQFPSSSSSLGGQHQQQPHRWTMDSNAILDSPQSPILPLSHMQHGSSSISPGHSRASSVSAGASGHETTASSAVNSDMQGGSPIQQTQQQAAGQGRWKYQYPSDMLRRAAIMGGQQAQQQQPNMWTSPLPQQNQADFAYSADNASDQQQDRASTHAYLNGSGSLTGYYTYTPGQYSSTPSQQQSQHRGDERPSTALSLDPYGSDGDGDGSGSTRSTLSGISTGTGGYQQQQQHNRSGVNPGQQGYVYENESGNEYDYDFGPGSGNEMQQQQMPHPPPSRDGTGGRVSAAFGGMNLDDGDININQHSNRQPHPLAVTLPASRTALLGLPTPSLSSVSATGMLGEQPLTTPRTSSEREAEMRELREFWKMYLRTPLSERDSLMATPRGEMGPTMITGMGFGNVNSNSSSGNNNGVEGSANENGHNGGRPGPKRGLSKVSSVPELRTSNGNGNGSDQNNMSLGNVELNSQNNGNNTQQQNLSLSLLLTPSPYRHGTNPYHHLFANPRADFYQHNNSMIDQQYSRQPSQTMQAQAQQQQQNQSQASQGDNSAGQRQTEDLRSYERAVIDRNMRMDKEVVLKFEPSSLRKRRISNTSTSSTTPSNAREQGKLGKEEGKDAKAKGVGMERTFLEPGLPASASNARNSLMASSMAISPNSDASLSDALNPALASGRPSVKRAPSQTLEAEHVKRTHHSYTPTGPGIRPPIFSQSSMRFIGQKDNAKELEHDDHDGSDADMDGEDGDVDVETDGEVEGNRNLNSQQKNRNFEHRSMAPSPLPPPPLSRGSAVEVGSGAG